MTASDPPPGGERRRHVRAPICALVQADRGEGQEFFFTRDLSPAGCFVLTDRPLPLGTRLSMRFTIPGLQGFLDAEAEVLRVNPPRYDNPLDPPGFSCRFVSMAAEDSARLNELTGRVASAVRGGDPEA